MRRDWELRLREVLEPLPTEEGGIAIVLATAGTPPAMAMLSSGDVLVTEERVRVGVYGTSSTVTRLGGSFSLLVPVGTVALRVEAIEATATRSGELALVDGRLQEVRPTAEPPWIAEVAFRPSHPGAAGVADHLQYWSAVREWLRGERDTSPSPPPPPGRPSDRGAGA